MYCWKSIPLCLVIIQVIQGTMELFYKNDLPIKIKDESIVVEIVIGRKKVFFTIIYKSPSHYNGSQQFGLFLNNFETLYENIKR